MMICWIPAVIIAAAQFGDWWHPVLVTIIFLAANNIDGMIIAPKVVGDSGGLHPLTVIISVLGWSLILGGLLGLLAVPSPPRLRCFSSATFGTVRRIVRPRTTGRLVWLLGRFIDFVHRQVQRA